MNWRGIGKPIALHLNKNIHLWAEAIIIDLLGTGIKLERARWFGSSGPERAIKRRKPPSPPCSARAWPSGFGDRAQAMLGSDQCRREAVRSRANRLGGTHRDFAGIRAASARGSTNQSVPEKWHREVPSTDLRMEKWHREIPLFGSKREWGNQSEADSSRPVLLARRLLICPLDPAQGCVDDRGCLILCALAVCDHQSLSLPG